MSLKENDIYMENLMELTEALNQEIFDADESRREASVGHFRRISLKIEDLI